MLEGSREEEGRKEGKPSVVWWMDALSLSRI